MLWRGRSTAVRKSDSAIMVMKAAEDGRRYDAAHVLDGAINRSVLVERPMSPQLIIISGILRQYPAQVRFASSRLFDLNGETDRVRKRQKSAIIAVDVRRFGHAINKDEVFGTHRSARVIAGRRPRTSPPPPRLIFL